MKFARIGLRLAAALLVAPLCGQAPGAGRNTVALRGQPQDLYCYPAQGLTGRPLGKVLFLPGDGGWRGFAIDMAQTAASFGYDVCGWDTKRYLTGFTSGQTTLKATDVAGDARVIARWMTRGGSEAVTLAGWSEGAGLGLLAVAADENKKTFSGLVAIGLPDYAFLGWRWADNLTYLSKKDPTEPRFDTLPYMGKVAPRPLAMIHSSQDEYVSPEAAKKLYEAAAQPKRFFLIQARNHRYDGNREDFFRALREALQWIRTTP
jgi:fermentation-respiration switch protein FrsA (DUF1100 family)